jgi:hypothetical protein
LDVLHKTAVQRPGDGIKGRSRSIAFVNFENTPLAKKVNTPRRP